MNFSLVCGNCRISEPSPISLWWDSLLSLIQRNSLPSSSGWLQDQLQKCPAVISVTGRWQNFPFRTWAFGTLYCKEEKEPRVRMTGSEVVGIFLS